MKTILVTGSEGLIGAPLCKKLKKYFKVFKIDTKIGKSVSNKSNLKKLIQSSDGVIHLAAESRVYTAYKYPFRSIKNNILGTVNILETIRVYNPKAWFVYGSSREVYGKTSGKTSETAKFDPLNVYAVSKVSGELFSRIYEQNYGLRTFIVRFSNVYGGLNDHNGRVTPKFFSQALQNKPITIEGGEQDFDFVYLDDAVDGVVKLVQKISYKKINSKTFHFVTGKSNNIKQLASLIIKITNSKSTIKFIKPRNYDVDHFLGNPILTKKELNWKAKITLEEGLKKYFQSIQKNKKAFFKK